MKYTFFPLSTTGVLALAAAFFGTTAVAADCSVTVEGNDAMQFSTDALVVPADCEQFSVTLKHVGKLPANAMGHNIVFGKEADMKGINADGMVAGAANNYVKPGDTRVIAASEVIGGGESTTVTIPATALQRGEIYGYICSFPGHATLMKGTLVVGD